jgi:hypothetical protein
LNSPDQSIADDNTIMPENPMDAVTWNFTEEVPAGT